MMKWKRRLTTTKYPPIRTDHNNLPVYNLLLILLKAFRSRESSTIYLYREKYCLLYGFVPRKLGKHFPCSNVITKEEKKETE